MDMLGLQRGMSTASFASSNSLQSGSSITSDSDKAHDIIVTTAAGDDPRFIMWGTNPAPLSQRVNSMQVGAAARASASSGSIDNPYSVSGSQTSSTRWSHTRKRSALFTELPKSNASGVPSPVATAQRVLMAATIERWIAEMTSKIESDLMTDFFLTYRSFLSPIALSQLLIDRFEWALLDGKTPEDIAGRRIVRVRTYVVIRHWLLNYFREDFAPSRDLRSVFTEWLNRMGKNERLRASPTDLRLIKSLKKVVKKLKAAYSSVGPIQALNANTLIAGTAQEAPHQGKVSMSSSADSSILADEARRTIVTNIEEKADSELNSGGRPPNAEVAPSPAHYEFGSGKAIQFSETHIRTSSSEDDVDLDIDIHPSGYESDERTTMPHFIPISPPRARYSPKSSPRSQRQSQRSPQLLSSLPVMPENNRLSRYFTSTVGSFGKLKRIMKYKEDSQHSDYRTMLPEDRDGLWERRDSLSSKKNMTDYPKEHDIDLQSNELKSGLGISDDFRQAQVQTRGSAYGPSSSAGDLRLVLEHTPSGQTIKSQTHQSKFLPSPHQLNTAELEDKPIATGQPLLAAPAEIDVRSGIQLDDYDSSDDESDYEGMPKTSKTIRRLPAARDLRTAGVGPAGLFNGIKMRQRHSVDTMSSYGTRRVPSIAVDTFRMPNHTAYDSGASSNDANSNEAIGQGVIPFFVLPVDSDDEEPGDVEAALRRLEGQVDQDKQRSKARKVENYLKLSEEAKANGHIEERFDDSEEDQAECEDVEIRAIRASDGNVFVEQTRALQPNSNAAVKVVMNRDTVDTNIEPALSAKPKLGRESPSRSHKIMFPVSEAEDTGQQTATAKRIQRKSSVRRFFSISRSSITVRPNPSFSALPPASPSHRSLLLVYKTESLARHFCIVERDLLEKISWQELMSGNWKERNETGEVIDWDVYLKDRARKNAALQKEANTKDGKSKKGGDVQVIIQRFNLMCNWIASESESSPSFFNTC